MATKRFLERSAFCACSAEKIFSVVNEVGRYADFVPWCTQSQVLKEEPNCVEGRLHLQKGPLNYWVASHNKTERPHSIDMSLYEGPFKECVGCWRFVEKNGGTQVSFELRYVFSNALLALTLGQAFERLADDMVRVFLQRAESLTEDL